MTRMSKVPTWPNLMQFGFGVLRLSSKDFWALTLLELDAAAATAASSGNLQRAMSRSELNDLMRAHPDRETA